MVVGMVVIVETVQAGPRSAVLDDLAEKGLVRVLREDVPGASVFLSEAFVALRIYYSDCE